MKKHIIAGACLLVAAGAANALGLLQAYEAALLNDPAYRAAQAEQEAGRQAAPLGRSALLPTLAASVSNAANRADLTSTDTSGQTVQSQPSYRSAAAVLSLRQPLFDLEGQARWRQGQAQAAYSEAVFAGKTQALLLRLVGAYADAQVAQDQLALAAAQRETLAEQLRQNERLLQQGAGTRTDVLETSAKVHLAEAQLIEARDQLATALATLAAIVGQDPMPLDKLAADVRSAALQPADVEDWKTIALAGNAEIAARRQALEVASQEVDKSRAGHAPRLDLVASVGHSKAEAISSYNQSATVRSIGLQLNIPLYSGGAVDATLRQALARRDQAGAELELATRAIDVELRKQHGAVLSGAARVEALAQAVDAARVLTEATRQSVKGGVRVNLDLLNAQAQVYSSQRDLARARYDQLLSRLRLKLAAGTLDATELRAVAIQFTTPR